jgi:hypothetical protein
LRDSAKSHDLVLETGTENLPRAVVVPAAVAAKIEKKNNMSYISNLKTLST